MLNSQKLLRDVSIFGTLYLMFSCIGVGLLIFMHPAIDHNYTDLMLNVVNRGKKPVKVRVQQYDSRRRLAEDKIIVVKPDKIGVEVAYPRINANDHTITAKGTLAGTNGLLYLLEIGQPSGPTLQKAFMLSKGWR